MKSALLASLLFLQDPDSLASLEKWRKPSGAWFEASDAGLDPANDKKLVGKPGKGVLLNGPDGKSTNLLMLDEHADVELHVEFVVSKGSNSGVYFMGRYEIQVLDSFGVKDPHYSDCGGIYQRWDPKRGQGKEGYEGRPPKLNASKPAGEWQSFDVVFRAPRFDAAGKKTANAKFVKVVHNGQLVHEDAEVTGPTRAASFEDEKPSGPLMLQGDHGPVAFRNFKMRKLSE